MPYFILYAKQSERIKCGAGKINDVGNSAICGELKTTRKADKLAHRDKNWNLSKNNKERANKSQKKKSMSKTRRSS